MFYNISFKVNKNIFARVYKFVKQLNTSLKNVG